MVAPLGIDAVLKETIVLNWRSLWLSPAFRAPAPVAVLFILPPTLLVSDDSLTQPS